MNESLLEGAFRGGVGLRGESHEAFSELVRLQRLEAGDHDVDSHVVLVPTQQMGLGQVFLHQVAGPLADWLLSPDHSDATTAA